MFITRRDLRPDHSRYPFDFWMRKLVMSALPKQKPWNPPISRSSFPLHGKLIPTKFPTKNLPKPYHPMICSGSEDNPCPHEISSPPNFSLNTAKIPSSAAQRLALLTRTITASAPPRACPIPRQIVNLPPAASKAMATLGSHEKKHKVTVVGSGNW